MNPSILQPPFSEFISTDNYAINVGSNQLILSEAQLVDNKTNEVQIQTYCKQVMSLNRPGQKSPVDSLFGAENTYEAEI